LAIVAQAQRDLPLNIFPSDVSHLFEGEVTFTSDFENELPTIHHIMIIHLEHRVRIHEDLVRVIDI
jgi:hypothetical protein